MTVAETLFYHHEFAVLILMIGCFLDQDESSI